MFLLKSNHNLNRAIQKSYLADTRAIAKELEMVQDMQIMLLAKESANP